MTPKKPKKLGWWRVTRSVLSSFFGVQSHEIASEDFEKGDFKIYVAIGIIAAIVFILMIWGVVQLVLK